MPRKRLPNIHPGEILEEEFLKPLGISRYRLAKAIGVPATRIGEICAGRRAITADTALRMARYFSTTAKFWMGLQEDYDIEECTRRNADALAAVVPLKKTA
jgi:addiction module HigA family antidote